MEPTTLMMFGIGVISAGLAAYVETHKGDSGYFIWISAVFFIMALWNVSFD